MSSSVLDLTRAYEDLNCVNSNTYFQNFFYRQGSVIADMRIEHRKIDWVGINQQNEKLTVELKKEGYTFTGVSESGKDQTSLIFN